MIVCHDRNKKKIPMLQTIRKNLWICFIAIIYMQYIKNTTNNSFNNSFSMFDFIFVYFGIITNFSILYIVTLDIKYEIWILKENHL